jgi:uncharacterized phage-associated protein
MVDMLRVSAHDIADELRRRLPGLGEKKLHKLLYYCQGHHLATFDEPLFSETISAWDMGPVVGQLWYRERKGLDRPHASELDEGQLNTVGYVVSRYGALSGAELERLTHSETPWIEANERREPQTSARIPNESIRAFFSHSELDDDDDTPLLDVDAVEQFLSGANDRQRAHRKQDTPDELRRRLTTGS